MTGKTAQFTIFERPLCRYRVVGFIRRCGISRVTLIRDAGPGVATVTQFERIIAEFACGILFRGGFLYMAFLTIFTGPVRVYNFFGAAVSCEAGKNTSRTNAI